MKRNRYFLLYFFLFLSGVMSSVHAGSFVTAKYGGDFLAVGVGARALGMGGTYVAVAQDGIAAYWNPAGLAQLNYPQINAMHSERFAGIVKYDYLGVCSPYSSHSSVGISLIRLGVDQGVHRIDDDGLHAVFLRRVLEHIVKDGDEVGEALPRAGAGGEDVGLALHGEADGLLLMGVEVKGLSCLIDKDAGTEGME